MKHFILTRGCIAKFSHLRQDYEAQKHVDLNAEPSIIGMPTYFGGTDVVSRSKQVAFLEKVYAVIKMHLLKEMQFQNETELQVYIIASRFMLAASLYVLSKIGSSKRNSALYRIIEDNLGITKENFLDEEDKETYYLTANRLIKTPNAFEHANEVLQKEKLKPFSEKEWGKFSKFLEDMCYKKEAKDKYINFPVISITRPLFGTTFSYVGATIGTVLAEGVSNSTSAVSPRLHLTALVGGTLFILNPAGTTGVALFAPVIATKLLTSFCTISLAHAMGTASGLLGQGVGICVGLPFDLAYNLLWSVCSVISRYYSKIPQLAPIDGIRLVDGATIIAGIPVQLISDHELPEGYAKKVLEITENGEIRIEGEETKSTDTQMKIPPEVLEELKKQLIVRIQKQGETGPKQESEDQEEENKAFTF